MTFITFFYKIGKRTFYGKYVTDVISDDHEGLDDEVRGMVLEGVNAFRKEKGLSPINEVIIGVLSYSFDNFAPSYSSEKEVHAFDFYCDDLNSSTRMIYLNGTPMKNHKI